MRLPWSYAGLNGGVEEDPAMTVATTPWFGQGYEPPWSSNDPSAGYSTGDTGTPYDEYGDPFQDHFALPDLESGLGEDWNLGMTYSVTSPASVLGLLSSQADWEAEQIGLGTPSQWWNADIVSYAGGVYAGYDPDDDGPTTNGDGLAGLLTDALHGSVGTMLAPPATNLVPVGNDGGSAPPPPEAGFWDAPPPPAGAVPGPQSAVVPNHNAEQPQGDPGHRPIDEVSPNTHGPDPRYQLPASQRYRPFDPQYVSGEFDTTDNGQVQTAAVVIIAVDPDTGEAYEEIVPVNEAAERISAEIARYDRDRKDAHQQWVDRYGTHMEFLDRMRELLANPNTTKTYEGDYLIFDYIEHRNAAEQLRMQLAGLSGGSYDSDWLNKASNAVANANVTDTATVIAVARERYPQVDRLLGFASTHNYSVKTAARGKSPAWVDHANKTVWVSEIAIAFYSSGPHSHDQSNRDAAAALLSALEELRSDLKGGEYDGYVQTMGGEDKTEFSNYDIFTAALIESGVATAYVWIAEAVEGKQSTP